MSRKARGKKQKQAVPEEILAEGSAHVEGAVVLERASDDLRARMEATVAGSDEYR